MFNLLTTTADKFRSVELGEASLYALLGFLIVFLGICLLIFIVWAIGKFMVKVNPAKAKKMQEKPSVIPVNETPEPVATKNTTNAVDEQTVAVITAALMAYYQTNNPKCEFIVKRIKRL